MNKDKILISAAIVFLGLSFIIGSHVLANAISDFGRRFDIETQDIGSPLRYMASELHEFRLDSTRASETTREKQTMYMSEAAEYLGFNFKELKFLIEEENINIPYIKVNRKYVFYKESLDQWQRKIEQQEYTF